MDLHTDRWTDGSSHTDGRTHPKTEKACDANYYIILHVCHWFLDSFSHLYKKVCLSIGRSAGLFAITEYIECCEV